MPPIPRPIPVNPLTATLPAVSAAVLVPGFAVAVEVLPEELLAEEVELLEDVDVDVDALPEAELDVELELPADVEAISVEEVEAGVVSLTADISTNFSF